MPIQAFNDIPDKGLPSEEGYNQMLLRKYLAGEIQNPIMASGRRPAYRAILSTKKGEGDFTDLQKAIDYINDLGGGTLFIKSGTYIFEQDINIYSNIRLVGEDDDLTIFDFNSDTAYIYAQGASGTHLYNIVIEGITFQNRRIAAGTDGVLHFEYTDDSKVIDCKFTDNWSSGDSAGVDLSLTNCQRFDIRNNRLLSSGEGIRLDLIDGSIVGNYFSDADADAIHLAGSASRIKILANTFDACNDNILTNSASVDYISFANNSINDHHSTGILIGTSSADYIPITGNIFIGGTSSVDAINLGADSDETTITGNIIRGWGDDGVDVHATAYGTTIVGNNITNNTGYGADMLGDGSVCVANVLSNNTAGATNSGGANIVDHNIV